MPTVIKRLRSLLALCLCVLFLPGCETGSPVSAAEAVAAKYYQSLKNRDFEAAADFFITGQQSRGQWLQQLKEYNGKLGDLKETKLTNTLVNTVFSGRRYILTYSVKYANFPATETLIMFEPVSGESIRIEAINVMSRGL